jgi:hypothetical protein
MLWAAAAFTSHSWMTFTRKRQPTANLYVSS